jgi:N-acetylmuramoyl-L-alanine amidase
LILAISVAPDAAQSGESYRVVTTDGARALAFQSSGNAEMVTLEAVARLFGLTVRDDARAGGAVVAAGTDRIVITAGQPTVSISGRLVSLSAPITRAGSTWMVPIDFLRVVRRGVEIRRGSRLVVVAPAVVPTVTPRFERTATGGRLTLQPDPDATSRVTRDGDQVTVRWQAHAVDLQPLAGAPSDMVADLRVADTSILVTLGAAVTGVRTADTATGRVTIELIAPGAGAAPASSATPPITFDRGGGIRTVVIDPGHGGDDLGARSPSGTVERDVTLAMANRLKGLLEARLGVRVILTRDGNVAVPIDRRAALANNNKADLFISVHANGAPLASSRGAQVLSLDADVYADVEGAAGRPDAPALPVPVVGGGTRLIDAVPWQLAQLPHATASATFARLVGQRMQAAGIPMAPQPVDVGPLRVLVGANMPAILVELGSLTNADDSRALGDPAHLGALAEAIAGAVFDVRAGIPRLAPVEPTTGGGR